MADVRSREQKILQFLQHASPDGATLSEINRSTGIDNRTLQFVLRKLTAKGAVMCKSSPDSKVPKKWSVMSAVAAMPSGKNESQHVHVYQKPAKSSQNLEHRTLQYLNQHREPKTAIEIAKGLGLTTKKDVNPILYKLEQKNLIQCKKREKGAPLWRLASDMETDVFRDTSRDHQAPGAYRAKGKVDSPFLQTNKRSPSPGESYHSGNRGTAGQGRGRGTWGRGRDAGRGRGRHISEEGQNRAQTSPPGPSHCDPGDNGFENTSSAFHLDSCSATAAGRDENQPSRVEGSDEDDDKWDNDSLDTDGDFDDYAVERRYGDLMGQNLYDSELGMIVSYQEEEDDSKMIVSTQDEEDGDMELLMNVLLVMKSVPNCTTTLAVLANKLQRTVKEIETVLKYGKSKKYTIEGGLPLFWRLTEEGQQFLTDAKKDHLIDRDVSVDPQLSSFLPERVIGISGLPSFRCGVGRGVTGPPLSPKELIQTGSVFAGNFPLSGPVCQLPTNFSSPNPKLPAAGIGRGQMIQRLSEEYGAPQNSNKMPRGAISLQELEASLMYLPQHSASAVPKTQLQMAVPTPTSDSFAQMHFDRANMHGVGDLQRSCSFTDRAAEITAGSILQCYGPLSLDSATATLTKSHSQPLLGSGPMSLPAGDGSGPSLKITSESFAALNKNPISALMEYAQSRHLQARIDVISQKGPSHRPVFAVAAWVGNRQFPVVTCSNKKDGRKEAADVALRTLIAEGQYTAASQSPSINVAPESMTHFDKIAALTHQAFNSLIASIPENLAGRKVIAGLVMKRSEDDIGMVVSIGTGNRCITGDKLSLEGNTVNDSHAEIITRRGFMRFLYQQLKTYQNGKSHELLEPGSSGKLRVRTGITFHLYISTAPCGDGALFSPRDTESNNGVPSNIDRREHHPTFTSNVQGLLRTKMEGGEGTIPVDSSEITIQTWDGVVRGERLRTMSCTDKICRWNVLGLQGALLSHFLEPIYLDSLTLGFLYDHGHLSRAVCCRLDREPPPLDTCLPSGFYLNHPWLGRVTACQPLRETQKTKAYSINWTVGDTQPEVLDGTLGHCYTAVEKTMFSRLAKRSLYNTFKQVAQQAGRSDLMQFSCYREAKLAAREFQKAKMAMMEKFKKTRCGAWVKKPVEEEMFS